MWLKHTLGSLSLHKYGPKCLHCENTPYSVTAEGLPLTVTYKIPRQLPGQSIKTLNHYLHGSSSGSTTRRRPIEAWCFVDWAVAKAGEEAVPDKDHHLCGGERDGPTLVPYSRPYLEWLDSPLRWSHSCREAESKCVPPASSSGDSNTRVDNEGVTWRGMIIRTGLPPLNPSRAVFWLWNLCACCSMLMTDNIFQQQTFKVAKVR